MEWWHYLLIAYGVVGLLLAVPILAAGAKFGQMSPAQGQPRMSPFMLVGGLLLAAFWPLIVVPLVLVVRKVKRAQADLGVATKAAFDAARNQGRVIDVEKK